MISKVLLNERQLFLLKYQRRNLIETDSSEQEGEEKEVTPEIIAQHLDSLSKKKPDKIDLNLIRGLFTTEIKEAKETEMQTDPSLQNPQNLLTESIDLP